MHQNVNLLLAVALAALPGCGGCGEVELQDLIGPGSIAGRVCDPGEAKGILGANVFVVAGNGAASERIEAKTDAEGRFEIAGVPVGTYTVFVERGSFRTSVDGVAVKEASRTALDESACLKPDTVSIAVFTGHDSVEVVLDRLGYHDATIVETHSKDRDRGDIPSWIVTSFGDLATFEQHDILFINCGPHEWAIDEANPTELAHAIANLRTFVAQGGSIYFSDWAYDLMERVYPDAVDWLGDDDEENAAEQGAKQDFTATVVDAELQTLLGKSTAELKFELGRIALPETLGPATRALLTADVEVSTRRGQTSLLRDVPVLLEHLPPGSVTGRPGRVLFTSFHNGEDNTDDMDELLRAIVFSL